MSDTIEKTTTDRETRLREPGDDERFSHYARKTDIEKAVLDGIPCTALCGKKWLPTRDPSQFPVCPDCKDLYENYVGSNLPEDQRD